jgi:O-antigen ligase
MAAAVTAHRAGSSPNVPLLPIWGVLALLPFGRSAEGAVLVAGLAAIVLLLRDPARVRSGAPLLMFALWSCYCGAALVSAIDAEMPRKSWTTVAALLRYVPLGLYVAFVVRDATTVARLYAGCALIGVVWLVDGWTQIATGFSLGGAAEAERLSGIFGADNLKFGPSLAMLSPFVLDAARRHYGRSGLAIAFAVLLVPVLLAGSRASWLVFGLVCAAFAWRETRRPLRFLLWIALASLLATAAALVAWRSSDAFDARVDKTLLALQGSSGAVDEALAGRLRIWQTSAAMIRAHPVNGVGVRGFRYAYAANASPGDGFVQRDGTGAAHAHHWVLEVLTETGVFGLVLWLAGIALACRAWWRAGAAARARAFVPAVALAATLFPFNTHLAFYSAWWGLLFWWLIAIFCAALYAGAAGADDGA